MNNNNIPLGYVVYDKPILVAKNSIHWQKLIHQLDDRLLNNLDELIQQFRIDIDIAINNDDDNFVEENKKSISISNENDDDKYNNIDDDDNRIQQNNTNNNDSNVISPLLVTSSQHQDPEKQQQQQQQQQQHQQATGTTTTVSASASEIILKETTISTSTPNNNNKHEGYILALWSCILGYCEAVSTNKDSTKRYNIYPIPYTALSRLVTNEFIKDLTSLNIIQRQEDEEEEQIDSTMSTTEGMKTSTTRKQKHRTKHRVAAQIISNYIWSKVMNKTSNSKDEKHANNLYTCQRGYIDKKGLDCFGSAICTVIGLKLLEYTSILTLSEDHAYESHSNDDDTDIDNDTTCTGSSKQQQQQNNNTKLATCEVAMSGNTNNVKSKRGQEISKTFNDKDGKQTSKISIDTSWLYMGNNPVLCTTFYMTLASIISNVDCTITITNTSSTYNEFSSYNLYLIKRELLWILYDLHHLLTFPFPLLELGYCEECIPSTTTRTRSSTIIQQQPPSSPITTTKSSFDSDDNNNSKNITTTTNIESLYIEAITISKTLYNDKQVYPYCYLGHYYRNCGLTTDTPSSESLLSSSSSFEYKFLQALQCYSEATRVASNYIYEWGDSLELTKVITILSEYIMNDILYVSCDDDNKSNIVRQWSCIEYHIAIGTWLLGFFDSLLLWEERSNKQFLSILSVKHTSGINKIFSLVPYNIRIEIYNKLIWNNNKSLLSTSSTTANVDNNCVIFDTTTVTADPPSTIATKSNFPSTQTNNLQYFTNPRSKRLEMNGLLIQSLLLKEKVSIKEIDLSIIVVNDYDNPATTIVQQDDTDNVKNNDITRRKSKRQRKR